MFEDHLLNWHRANRELRKETASRGSLNHVQNVHLDEHCAKTAFMTTFSLH